jgi:hypothetical protein
VDARILQAAQVELPDPRLLLGWALWFAPLLLAALVAGFLALFARSGWGAFATAILLTMILAPALAALAQRLPIWGGSFAQPWLFHLMLSPVFGVPVGILCAAWVGRRPPPSIRQ